MGRRTARLLAAATSIAVAVSAVAATSVVVASVVMASAAASHAAPPAPADPLPASPPVFGVAMEEAWIPMPDGARLAADIWRPTTVGEKARAGAGAPTAKGRFPVLLEYLPYRKTE